MGAVADDMRQALDERSRLIEKRADAVLGQAIPDGSSWLEQLGAQPAVASKAGTWWRTIRLIAAYRDRYRITTDTPLGEPAGSTGQKVDRARAEATLCTIATLDQPRKRLSGQVRAQTARGVRL